MIGDALKVKLGYFLQHLAIMDSRYCRHKLKVSRASTIAGVDCICIQLDEPMMQMEIHLPEPYNILKSSECTSISIYRALKINLSHKFVDCHSQGLGSQLSCE